MRSALRKIALLRALLAALLWEMPALAARTPLPPVPAITLDGAAPLIEADVAGQRLRLTVDLGGDDVVLINPGSRVRAVLDGEVRTDGKPVDRGRYRVAVGQQAVAVPFSRETLMIGGRAIKARLLTPEQAPPGQTPASDGIIGLPLLPHEGVTLRWRPATAGDRMVTVPARIGRSDAVGFDWALAGGETLDVEIHPLRPVSVASAAAASLLAQAGGGRLEGPVRRVLIGFGVSRPVRRLALARPVAVAGLGVSAADVRLFDWAGRSNLPPDADPDAELTAVGKRGRQGSWAVLKLGQDVIAACASIRWQRSPAQLELTCAGP